MYGLGWLFSRLGRRHGGLQRCPRCKMYFSNNADACPYCVHIEDKALDTLLRQRKRQRQRMGIIMLLLALVILASMFFNWDK